MKLLPAGIISLLFSFTVEKKTWTTDSKGIIVSKAISGRYIICFNARYSKIPIIRPPLGLFKSGL